jgi:hypothetical protein
MKKLFKVTRMVEFGFTDRENLDLNLNLSMQWTKADGFWSTATRGHQELVCDNYCISTQL